MVIVLKRLQRNTLLHPSLSLHRSTQCIVKFGLSTTHRIFSPVNRRPYQNISAPQIPEKIPSLLYIKVTVPRVIPSPSSPISATLTIARVFSVSPPPSSTYPICLAQKCVPHEPHNLYHLTPVPFRRVYSLISLIHGGGLQIKWLLTSGKGSSSLPTTSHVCSFNPSHGLQQFISMYPSLPQLWQTIVYHFYCDHHNHRGYRVLLIYFCCLMLVELVCGNNILRMGHSLTSTTYHICKLSGIQTLPSQGRSLSLSDFCANSNPLLSD